jgi:hypothetical protein
MFRLHWHLVLLVCLMLEVNLSLSEYFTVIASITIVIFISACSILLLPRLFGSLRYSLASERLDYYFFVKFLFSLQFLPWLA